MQALIRADQLVYTNVSAEYSPDRRRGYQTVWSSPGISGEDREAIERRIAGLPEARSGAVRWQLFNLYDDRIAITRSQYFPNDPEISDPRGAFIAHALVISGETYAKTGCNPWRILDGFAFLRSAREWVDSIRLLPGAAGCGEIEVVETIPKIGEWSGEAILAVLRLAADAENLNRERRSVMFRGEPAEVEAVLRLVYLLSAPAWRRHCTFDTFADLSASQPGEFWAVGTPSRHEKEGYISLHSRTLESVMGAGLAKPLPESLYARWLENQLGNGVRPVASCVHLAGAVELTTRALEASEPKGPVSLIGPDVSAAIWSVARARVEQRIKEQLAGLNLRELDHVLRCRLFSRLDADQQIQLALGVVDLKERMSVCILEWLIDAKPALDKSARKSLHKFFGTGHHRGLALLMPISQRARDEILAGIQADDFRQILVLCPSYVTPAELACANHGDLLLQRVAEAEAEITPEQLFECLAALAEAHFKGTFSPVQVCLRKLDRKQLCRLLEMPGDPWSSDPKFKESLDRMCHATEKTWSLIHISKPWHP